MQDPWFKDVLFSTAGDLWSESSELNHQIGLSPNAIGLLIFVDHYRHSHHNCWLCPAVSFSLWVICTPLLLKMQMFTSKLPVFLVKYIQIWQATWTDSMAPAFALASWKRRLRWASSSNLRAETWQKKHRLKMGVRRWGGYHSSCTYIYIQYIISILCTSISVSTDTYILTSYAIYTVYGIHAWNSTWTQTWKHLTNNRKNRKSMTISYYINQYIYDSLWLGPNLDDPWIVLKKEHPVSVACSKGLALFLLFHLKQDSLSPKKHSKSDWSLNLGTTKLVS